MRRFELHGGLRTDLAKELYDVHDVIIKRRKKYKCGGGETFTLEEAEIAGGSDVPYMKPAGKYISVMAEKLISELSLKESLLLSKIIKDELLYLAQSNAHNVSVIGMGNREMTVDSLGVRCAEMIKPTRGRYGDTERGLSVIIPGVESATGIATLETVRSIFSNVRPSLAVAVDSLAARSVSRLGTAVQICDTGISPGSGLGKRKASINSETTGTGIISIGVPTVISAKSLLADLSGEELEEEICYVGLIDSDAVIEASARIIATAIEEAFS